MLCSLPSCFPQSPLPHSSKMTTQDSLADEVFSFSIDVDRAQALQSGDDVGEQRGAAIVLQSLEHADGHLKLPASRMRVSDLGRPTQGPPSSTQIPAWYLKSQTQLTST